MSVAAWKRIAVGTKVRLVSEGRPHDSITGVVKEVTATFLTIFGDLDSSGLYAHMTYRWPKSGCVISDEPGRLTWQNPRYSKITLALRGPMTNPIVAYSDRLGFALCASCAESENRTDYPYDSGNSAVLGLGDCVLCGRHLADLYDPRHRIPKETTR